MIIHVVMVDFFTVDNDNAELQNAEELKQEKEKETGVSWLATSEHCLTYLILYIYGYRSDLLITVC